MKEINERQLLLAIGDVGDDLLERAEHVHHRRAGVVKWAALAACLCVLVVSASMVLPSFRMGNSMAPEPEEGLTGGNQSVSQDMASAESGSMPTAALSAANCLEDLGITSAEDLNSWQWTKLTYLKEDAAAGEVKEESDAYNDTVRQQDGAALYEVLCGADAVAAAEDDRALNFTVTLTLTLTDGTVLSGAADMEQNVVQLGDYHFNVPEFSQLLEQEDGKEQEEP